MQVLIIRHAIAEAWAESDALRPLSDKGRTKMRQQIQGLQRIVTHIDRIVSSPLLRARQTADLLYSAYPKAQRDTLPALAPGGSTTAILAYLQQQAETVSSITLVGHEPDLGELATWLLTNRKGDWCPFKKGAACLLAFEQTLAAGQATLCWSLKPVQLRYLSKT